MSTNTNENEFDISSGDLNTEIDSLDLMIDDEAKHDIPIIGRYSCAAHNLQLTLFHGIKASLATSSAFKTLLKFQSQFGHSQQARYKLKQESKLYKTFVPTRWACWIDVVKCYLEIKESMKRVIIKFINLKFIFN